MYRVLCALVLSLLLAPVALAQTQGPVSQQILADGLAIWRMCDNADNTVCGGATPRVTPPTGWRYHALILSDKTNVASGTVTVYTGRVYSTTERQQVVQAAVGTDYHVPFVGAFTTLWVVVGDLTATDPNSASTIDVDILNGASR